MRQFLGGGAYQEEISQVKISRESLTNVCFTDFMESDFRSHKVSLRTGLTFSAQLCYLYGKWKIYGLFRQSLNGTMNGNFHTTTVPVPLPTRWH